MTTADRILMKRTGLDEATAFRRLQDMSRNKNRKLAEVAEMFLTAEEAYSNTDKNNGT